MRKKLKQRKLKRHRKKRLKWYGHVMCISAEQIPKRDASDKTRGKRPKGRPRTRWLNQIRENIEDRGQTWTVIHTTKTWEDRDEWISLCNSQSKRLETKNRKLPFKNVNNVTPFEK